MRILFFLAIAAIPVAAQNPSVRLTNTTRPGIPDFQVGDRFEIVIMAEANQPVSVRTTMHGRTDWGPVIGWTDTSGRWSTAGQFEKTDFGDWSEAWTVGGKLANPVADFTVAAPCLKGGQGQAAGAGYAWSVSCETAAGEQSFGTPTDTDPFRTPDGRVVPGRMRSNKTAEQYHAEIIQTPVTSRTSDIRPGWLGDEAGAAITKIIGINALSEGETRNVLAIVRAAFEMPERIPQAARDPSAGQESLKRQIAETMVYVRVQQ